MTDSIPQDTPTLKHCNGCPEGQQWHPATFEYFYHNKRTKDGLDSRCKKCVSKQQKAYHSKPSVRAQRLAGGKAYKERPEVREHRKAYSSVYNNGYWSRPEVLEKQRQRRRTPEGREINLSYKRRAKKHIREVSRAYERRPEVRARLRVHQQNYHARKKAVQGVHTAAQIQEQLKRQRYRCYYAACGYSKFQKKNGKYIFHIEHTFPLSRVAGSDIPANDMSYLVLACPHCNASKHNKLPHEFYEGGRLL